MVAVLEGKKCVELEKLTFMGGICVVEVEKEVNLECIEMVGRTHFCFPNRQSRVAPSSEQQLKLREEQGQGR